MKQIGVLNFGIFVANLTIFAIPAFSWESPSNAPLMTFEEMCKKSRNIVVAEYQTFGFEKGLKASEYVWTKFKIIDKVKNSQTISDEITVEYAFNNVPDNFKPEGWKFSKDLMPKKNSRWILFLQHYLPSNNTYYTYRGNYGRVPYREETVDKIKKVLK